MMTNWTKIHPVVQWVAVVLLMSMLAAGALLLAFAAVASYEFGRHWTQTALTGAGSFVCVAGFVYLLRKSRGVDWRVSEWIDRKLTDAGWLR